ncbi:MAG: class I SAM-dependent methyltransferase, partial [Alphaproteobacteria bacterium]
DPNESRIAVCRDRIIATGLSGLAMAEVGDIRSFHCERRFKLITSPFRSLQHLLTPSDQRRALDTAYAHLAPGGRFVVDVFNPSIPMLADTGLQQEFGDGRKLPAGNGGTVELRNRILSRDYAAQLQHAEEIYIFTGSDGSCRRVVLPFTTRYTFRFEWEHLAALAGFDIEAVFGGYDRSPFGEQYPGEILMILRRP